MARRLKQGLAPFEQIRRAVGDRMEIMCEMHSLWTLPPAIRIGQALRDVAPFWVEDPIRMDDPASVRRFADATGVRVIGSETLGTRTAFRALLEAQAVDYVMFDVGWCGGLTSRADQRARRYLEAAGGGAFRPVIPDGVDPPRVPLPNTLIRKWCARSSTASIATS
jgi:L-alanine-DL-glutamate epimerase-like enolase superfamily enzyme